MLSPFNRFAPWMLWSAVLCAAPVAQADEVVLATGVTKIGIIESETDEMVRLRTDVGTTGISRAFIVEIHRATPEENAALEMQWASAAEAAKEQRREQAEAERAFADQQRQKGLILYEGEWLTKQEIELRAQMRRDELVAENDRRVAAAIDDRDRARQDLAAATEQMAALTAEIDARDATIEDLKRQLRQQDDELNRTQELWAEALHRLRNCRSALAACQSRP